MGAEEELESHCKEKDIIDDELANFSKQECPVVKKRSFKEAADSEEKLTWVEEESDNIKDTKTFDQHSSFEDKIADDEATNHVVGTFTSNDRQKEENIKV